MCSIMGFTRRTLSREELCPYFDRTLSRGPDCSYAVYLFHFPLLQWMISRGLFDAFPWLSLFICAALTYVLAFAATRAEKRLFHGGKGS